MGCGASSQALPADKKIKRKGLNVDGYKAAIEAHKTWLARLTTLIRQARVTLPECQWNVVLLGTQILQAWDEIKKRGKDDHGCAFGKWMFGAGKESFEEWDTVAKLHYDFHKCVAAIMNEAEVNPDDATKMLQSGEIVKTSQHLIQILTTLSEKQ